MQRFRKLFLLFQASVCSGVGLLIFFSPKWFQTVTTISATDLHGLTDIRATYGGIFTAVGIACLFAAGSRARQATALHLLVTVYAGLSLARLLAAVLERDSSVYTLICLIFEVLSFVTAYLLLRQHEALPRKSFQS